MLMFEITNRNLIKNQLTKFNISYMLIKYKYKFHKQHKCIIFHNKKSFFSNKKQLRVYTPLSAYNKYKKGPKAGNYRTLNMLSFEIVNILAAYKTLGNFGGHNCKNCAPQVFMVCFDMTADFMATSIHHLLARKDGG